MIYSGADANHLVASHHAVLVALSLTIAVLASYVALDLGGRIRASVRGFARNLARNGRSCPRRRHLVDAFRGNAGLPGAGQGDL